MSASLFSQSWYRVADLKVRLRKHAKINRHRYRGSVWYVLQDHVTGQFHRFTPEVYQVVGLMDGHRTLQEIWKLSCERLGDNLPSQDEIIELVSRLYQANVLHTDRLPDIADLHNRQQEQNHKKLLQQMKSPLGIRVPLLDPEQFLNKTSPFLKPLFSVPGVIIWIVVVFYALTLAGIHWSTLTHNISDQVLSLENLLVITLVYPVVKAIHELGHAYMLKRFGGEVHEMGVMLLVFVPVPYVDASAAAAFGNKYQRMLVGAAGILVEAFVAALAMMVWASAEHGVLRMVAFNVMLIAGVSTVLFNGNPLLRFDAYYVFSDWLELPNLAARANQYFSYLVKRYLYGLKDLAPQSESRRESFWLASYAISSFVYRLFVMVAIALFVANKYFVIGVLIAMLSIYQTIILPVVKLTFNPLRDPLLRRSMRKIYSISIALLSAMMLFVIFVPVPYSTLTEGVLRISDNALVRVSGQGFVDAVVAAPGSSVKQGDTLIVLSDRVLDTEIAVLTAQVKEAQARYHSSIKDRAELEIVREELAYLNKELQRSVERKDAMTIRSANDGVFLLPDAQNLPGRYVERGRMLGYVVNYSGLPLLVPVSEDSIDQVRYHTKSVELRFVSGIDTSYAGRILRVNPSATRELPSMTLATEGGGRIARDPSSTDSLLSFEKYFYVEVEFDAVLSQRIDERVYVLFAHDAEPLFRRWYRAVRRVFLRQLDV